MESEVGNAEGRYGEAGLSFALRQLAVAANRGR